jgi:hypothetical protein
VPIPDLELTVRLVGLPLPELWGRYLAVGGSSTLDALSGLIDGQLSWSAEEELFLAVALSDAMVDESLVSLDPLKAFLEGQPSWGGLSATDHRLPAESSLPAVETVVALDQLVLRAQAARASARRIRRSAREARRRAVESHDRVRSAEPTSPLPGG